jgi:regulatory protein
VPIVTKIEPDGRRPRRVRIEVDGEPFAEVAARAAERLGLEPGREVERDAFARELERAETESAMERALGFLSYRSRSREEVRRRLDRDAVPDPIRDRVLGRLEGTGLLDDDAFCAAYVRSRIAVHPEGVRRMAEELHRRGVPRTRSLPAIQRALEGEGVTEAELLARAGEKRLRALGGLSPAVARRRLFEHLARRGFPLEAVRAWVEEAVGD